MPNLVECDYIPWTPLSCRVLPSHCKVCFQCGHCHLLVYAMALVPPIAWRPRESPLSALDQNMEKLNLYLI